MNEENSVTPATSAEAEGGGVVGCSAWLGDLSLLNWLLANGDFQAGTRVGCFDSNEVHLKTASVEGIGQGVSQRFLGFGVLDLDARRCIPSRTVRSFQKHCESTGRKGVANLESKIGCFCARCDDRKPYRFWRNGGECCLECDLLLSRYRTWTALGFCGAPTQFRLTEANYQNQDADARSRALQYGAQYRNRL